MISVQAKKGVVINLSSSTLEEEEHWLPSYISDQQIVYCILKWSDENFRDFIWRKDFSPYRVFVAEMLLRRTTASAVQRIYETFIQSYRDLNRLAEADPVKLECDLRSLGYHKVRAHIIKQTANIMYHRHGEVPNSMESLLSIKHIGLYIAGAIMSLGFDMPVPMVDTNVLRILSRIYGRYINQKEGFDMLKD